MFLPSDYEETSFPADKIPDVLEEILNTYLDLRLEDESFLETYKRVSIQPFKERAYADIN